MRCNDLGFFLKRKLPTYLSISGCPTRGYWDLQCLSSFGVVVSSMGSFSPTSHRIFVAWLEWRVITIDGIRKVLVSFLLVFLNSSVLRGCSVIVQAWDINSRLFFRRRLPTLSGLGLCAQGLTVGLKICLAAFRHALLSAGGDCLIPDVQLAVCSVQSGVPMYHSPHRTVRYTHNTPFLTSFTRSGRQYMWQCAYEGSQMGVAEWRCRGVW